MSCVENQGAGERRPPPQRSYTRVAGAKSPSWRGFNVKVKDLDRKSGRHRVGGSALSQL